MTEQRCPECGGLNGAHGSVHVRHRTGGGGWNRLCSRTPVADLRFDPGPECTRCGGLGVLMAPGDSGPLPPCPDCMPVEALPDGVVGPLTRAALAGDAERAARLEAFARSVVDLDDPDPQSPGFQRRSGIRLQRIIDDARAALGEA